MSEFRTVANATLGPTLAASAQVQQKRRLEKQQGAIRNFKTSLQVDFLKSVLECQDDDEQHPGAAWRKAIAISIGQFFGVHALQSFQISSKRSESTKCDKVNSSAGLEGAAEVGSTAENANAIGGGGSGGGGSGGGGSGGGSGDRGGKGSTGVDKVSEGGSARSRPVAKGVSVALQAERDRALVEEFSRFCGVELQSTSSK